MKRFRRGDQVWGRRDDGTWALWDRRNLTWIPQATRPPSEELTEITQRELKINLTRALEHQRPTWVQRSRAHDPSKAKRSRTADTLFWLMLAGIFVVGIFALLWAIDLFL